MRELVALVRLAYSAELAAAWAYRGHARSVRAERVAIRRIAAEEYEHRENLRGLLVRLGARPSRWLELKYRVIGAVIAGACFVIGRFMPMYFAGRLESGNVNEYLRMEELAAGSPIADAIPCMRRMAEVEKEHEEYFLAQVLGHRLLPLFARVFRWGPGRSFNPLPSPAAALTRA